MVIYRQGTVVAMEKDQITMLSAAVLVILVVSFFMV